MRRTPGPAADRYRPAAHSDGLTSLTGRTYLARNPIPAAAPAVSIEDASGFA